MERLRTAILRAARNKGLLLCLVAAAGLLLLSFSGGEKKQNSSETERSAAVAAAETRLETKARRLLSGVRGVGRAEVTVTLDCLESVVYLRNTSRDETGGKETSEYVLVSGAGGKEGLAEKILAPQVRGVAVCCRGGDDPQIRKEVSGLVCAVFGIAPNRVYITAMK